jgi:Raf kinase inhibitor-like YbhB/YbcL family protein
MWLRLGMLAGLVALTAAPAASSSFTLETSAFLNGGTMPKTDAASAAACGGRNVSPPLRLSGYPPAVRSFAIVLFDPDAGRGAGFTHWIAYGIAPSAAVLPPGFGSQPSPAFTGGTNDAGTALYYGPCPPEGDPAHHYVFTAYALDLVPDALKPGLTYAAFLRAIAAHRLAQAQITGRYAR